MQKSQQKKYHVQNKYKELVDNEKWVVKKSNDTIFNVSKFSCWNCGATTHKAGDCPKPLVRDKDGKTWIDRVRAHKAKNGGGRGGGRGGKRGKDNGGRGSGGKGGDRKKKNIFTRAPVEGESQVRKRGNYEEKWCNVCGVWGSHSTKEHEDENALVCTEVIKEGDENQNEEEIETPFAGLLSDFRRGH